MVADLGALGLGQAFVNAHLAQQQVHRRQLRVEGEHHLGVRPIPRKGNRSPGAAPSNLYRCRPFGPNDYVFIHTANLDMWKALTRVIEVRPPEAKAPTERIESVPPEEAATRIADWLAARKLI